MKKRFQGYICAIIATSAWGSAYVASKYAMAFIPPFTLLLIRYGIAVLTLSVLPWRKSKARIDKKDYKFVFLIGFMGYFISIGAQFVGTQLAGASLASMISSMNPVFMILFSVVLLKERIAVGMVASVLVSLFGVYVILGGVTSTDRMMEGIIVSLFAGLSWSFVSVASKRVNEKYDAVQVTLHALVIGFLFTLPVSIREIATSSGIVFMRPEILFSIFYLGTISTAIALVCWNKALSLIIASTCSLFYPLMPMVSVILGAIILGERMNGAFFAGGALIITGVMLSVLSGRIKSDGKA